MQVTGVPAARTGSTRVREGQRVKTGEWTTYAPDGSVKSTKNHRGPR